MKCNFFKHTLERKHQDSATPNLFLRIAFIPITLQISRANGEFEINNIILIN